MCIIFFGCHVKTDGSGSIEDEILKLQASGKSVPEAKKKELISDLQVRQSHLPLLYIFRSALFIICISSFSHIKIPVIYLYNFHFITAMIQQ